jgi:uronate dehydrogenase
LYADTYGIDVYCLRIGSCFEVPTNVRHLSTWLSPDDGARLMNACLGTDNGGFQPIWGVSANARRWWPPLGVPMSLAPASVPETR